MAKKRNAFNTVTPLSKALAMVLFITLPFLGFYLGMQYQKILIAANPTPTAVKAPEDSAPELVAHTFYFNYITCLNRHFQNPTGTPLQNCSFQNDPNITSGFAENIKKNTAGDPVLCAQNVPFAVQTEDALISENNATVLVHEIFGIKRKEVRVSLEKIGDDWKLSNVTCL